MAKAIDKTTTSACILGVRYKSCSVSWPYIKVTTTELINNCTSEGYSSNKWKKTIAESSKRIGKTQQSRSRLHEH